MPLSERVSLHGRNHRRSGGPYNLNHGICRKQSAHGFDFLELVWYIQETSGPLETVNPLSCGYVRKSNGILAVGLFYFEAGGLHELYNPSVASVCRSVKSQKRPSVLSLCPKAKKMSWKLSIQKAFASGAISALIEFFTANIY